MSAAEVGSQQWRLGLDRLPTVPWIPKVKPGAPFGWDASVETPGGSTNADISLNGLVASTPPVPGDGTGFVVVSNAIGDLNGSIPRAVYFKLPSPVLSHGLYSYCGFAGAPGEQGPSFAAIPVITSNGSSYSVVFGGNPFGEDAENIDPPINLSWSSEIEYCIAYSGSTGPFGTLYLYTSLLPDIPVYTYEFTQAHESPSAFLGYVSSDGSGEVSCTLLLQPTVLHSGLNPVLGGGLLDSTAYPNDAAGKAFEVSLPNGPVVSEEVGIIQHGDIVFFNSHGVLQGVALTRKAVETDPGLIESLNQSIAAGKGLLGLEKYTPVEGNQGYTIDDWAGTQYVGWLKHGQFTDNNIISRVHIEADAGSYNQDYLAGYTRPILPPAMPTTMSGIYFKLPVCPDFDKFHTSDKWFNIGFGDQLRHSAHGFSQFINNNSTEGFGAFLQLRFNNVNSPGTYPESGPGVHGWFRVEGATGIEITAANMTLDDTHVYFMGADRTNFRLQNVNTGQQIDIDHTNGSSIHKMLSTGMRFMWGLYHQSNLSGYISNLELEIVPSPPSKPYPRLTDGYPNLNGTVSIDTGDLPGGRSNRSFEVDDLELHLTYQDKVVRNGDIAFFNSHGDLTGFSHKGDPTIKGY